MNSFIHVYAAKNTFLSIFNIFFLQEVDREADAADTFAIETRNGKGIISLISNLDFERKSLYQLRIIASVSIY